MSPVEDLTGVLLDGRYQLTRLIGQGGMGQVYEGFHGALDRKVAVKVLLPRYAHETKFRERFLREAKAASKVRHPNVVQILDFGDTPGGSVYFAMEYLEGCDLQTLLQHEGALPWPRARYFLLQMVSALAAAHERRIIHRDIKPANFFITDERGRPELVKVLDFGIAKLAVDGSNHDSSLAQSLTSTGEVFGTAKYMAPEQAYGASDDPRVDVYSLGIVAYEMLTGQVPFTGVSMFHVITQHVNEPPRPPRELAAEIPIAVEAVILRALAKHPNDRFFSMEALEQALLAIPPGPGGPVAGAVALAGPFLPPRSPDVSEQLTALVSASAESAAPRSVPPPPAAATSVMPTRLAAPSSVAPGDVAVPRGARGASGQAPASGPAWPPRVASASGTEEWEAVGGATAQLQGVGEGGSATGPMDSRTAGARVAETDPHAVLPRPPASPRQGLLLALLGTLGGGALMFAGYFALASNDADELAAAPKPVVVQAPAVVPEAEALEPVVVPTAVPPPAAGSTGAPPSDDSTPTVDEPIEPVPTVDEPSEPVTAEPKPTAAKTKPTTKPPSTTKPPAPPTDTKVSSQLARALTKKCGSLGRGSKVTVNVLVAADGHVLSKSVVGASGELHKCLVAGVGKAEFPAGKTRTVPIVVAL